MILKTPAIVLRQHPYTETSRVVTWLTPDRGRLNTLIKGAMRPKSGFLGQFDLFYTCELLYYARAGDGLPIARELAPLSTRPTLRTDWRACAVASYLCALVSRAMPAQAARRDLYDWLESALDDLAARGGSAPALCGYELSLLQRLGLAPRLASCLGCGGSPPAAGEVAFAYAEGGWYCSRCASAREAAREQVWLPAEGLAHLRAWQRANSPDEARAAAAPFSAQEAIERALGLFLAHHVDAPPAPRAAALDILARRPLRLVDRAGGLR